MLIADNLGVSVKICINLAGPKFSYCAVTLAQYLSQRVFFPGQRPEAMRGSPQPSSLASVFPAEGVLSQESIPFPQTKARQKRPSFAVCAEAKNERLAPFVLPP